MQDDDLIPLRKTDLVMGKPLRWSVYDDHGVLLLARGLVLDSEHKIEVLFKKGLFRSARREMSYAKAPVESTPLEEESGNPFHYRHDRDKGKRIHPVAKLPIGIVVSLQANADDNSERYVCRYIGYQEEKSLLVTNPLSDGRLVPCHDGQSFFVRCFNGKTALAFKSHIVKAHLAPFPYLHLSFPKEVTVMKVRESYRADVDIIATVAIGGAKAAVRINNLGVGGAHILSAAPLGEMGETGTMSFKIAIEDIEAYVNAPITIRSRALEMDEGRSLYAYGVQFRSLARDHKTMIMNLAYRANVVL